MERIQKFFMKSVLYTMLVLVTYITYSSMTRINSNAVYVKKYFGHPMLINLLGMLLLGTIIFLIFKYIDKESTKKDNRITMFLFFVIVALQIIFVCNFNIVQITDSYMVNDQAMLIAQNKSDVIDPTIPYFQKYGNNYFVTVVTSYVFRVFIKFGIKDTSFALSILNLLLLDVSVVLLWRTVHMIKGKKSASKFLVLCALNPVFYLMIGWYYTAVYCIPFMAGIIYLSVCLHRLIREDKFNYKVVLYGVLLGITLVIGYQIRPTTLILGIAFAIVLFLYMFQNKAVWKKSALLVLILVVTMGAVFTLTNSMTKKYVADDSKNFPITHWIMMGLHGEGTFLQKDEQFTDSFPTKEEKKDANLTEIKKTIKKKGVVGLVEHVFTKLKITWTDCYADFNIRLSQDRTSSKLYQHIVSGRTDFIVIYAQVYYNIIWFLILVAVIARLMDKKLSYMFAFLLSAFGCILFYVLWEAKAVYAASFYLLLALCAFDGQEQLANRYIGLQEKYKTMICNMLSKVVIILIGFTVLIGALQYHNFVKVKATWTDYSVRSNTPQFMQWNSTVGADQTVLEQTFYASKPFNEIAFAGKPIKKAEASKCSYEVSVLDQNGAVIEKRTINQKNISNQLITIKLKETVKPKNKNEYKLIIKGNNNTDSISFGHRISEASDNYQGTYTLNGEKKQYDLYLIVKNVYKSAYSSPVKYCCLFLCTLILEGFLYVLLSKKENRIFNRLKALGGN